MWNSSSQWEKTCRRLWMSMNNKAKNNAIVGSHFPQAGKNTTLWTDQFKIHRGNCQTPGNLIEMKHKWQLCWFPNMERGILVWKRLWRIMFTPRGREEETEGRKYSRVFKHLQKLAWTHTQMQKHIREQKAGKLAVQFLCSSFNSTDVSCSVFNNKRYVEEKATLG